MWGDSIQHNIVIPFSNDDSDANWFSESRAEDLFGKQLLLDNKSRK